MAVNKVFSASACMYLGMSCSKGLPARPPVALQRHGDDYRAFLAGTQHGLRHATAPQAVELVAAGEQFLVRFL